MDPPLADMDPFFKTLLYTKIIPNNGEYVKFISFQMSYLSTTHSYLLWIENIVFLLPVAVSEIQIQKS